jgi:hypothetical protein
MWTLPKRDRFVGGLLEVALQRHVRDHAGDIRIRGLQARDGLVERVLFDVAHHDLDAGLRQRGRRCRARCRMRRR